MSKNMESSNLASKYLGEFCSLWDALTKRHLFLDEILILIRDQQKLIVSLHQEVHSVMKSQQDDQDNMEKLKQEMSNSLRVVDATHAREQVAQETIDNLRQQITRINAELELKSRLEVDQEGDFKAMAKNKEVQSKEKEKFEEELNTTQYKYNSLMESHDDLKKELQLLTIKNTELSQELENKKHELTKDDQLKAKQDEDLVNKAKLINEQKQTIQLLEAQLKEISLKFQQSENVMAGERYEAEKLKRQFDDLSQRYVKFQEAFSSQARAFETIAQKINVVGQQLKHKEVELVKSRAEYTTLTKVVTASSKKIERLEDMKKKIEKEKDAQLVLIKMHEKEINLLKKKIVDEKKKNDSFQRDKDNFRKVTERFDEKILDLTRKLTFAEQVRHNQQIDITLQEKTIGKLKSLLTTLDKEKERYVEEAKTLTVKVETLMENMKMKNAEVFAFNKKLLEADTQFQLQQNLFDAVRTERNACAKELLVAQDDIDECKRKMKVMAHQVEQLKEDISCKEKQLTREEFAYRKLQSEIEAQKVEVQKWKDSHRDAKGVIDEMREEMKEVKHTIEVSEAKRFKMRKETDRILNEKDILGSQLVRRNDEITLLYEKVRLLQVTLDRGKYHYNQRVEDIRLLKTEVDHIRGEKMKLTKFVANTTDFRTEIYHLERDLTKERLKSRALEEELQTPLNIHRWRKLEGSDPDKLELIQKIQILQKRILRGISASQEQDRRLKESNKKYQALKEELHRQPGPDVIDRLGKTQVALKMKTKNTKCLLGQVSAFKSEIADLNLSTQHLKNELYETKKMYFEQKSLSEKYKQQLDQHKVPRDKENDPDLMILPPIESGHSIHSKVDNVEGNLNETRNENSRSSNNRRSVTENNSMELVQMLKRSSQEL